MKLLCYLIQSEFSQLRRIQTLNPLISQQAICFSEYVTLTYSPVRNFHKECFRNTSLAISDILISLKFITAFHISSYISKRIHTASSNSSFLYFVKYSLSLSGRSFTYNIYIYNYIYIYSIANRFYVVMDYLKNFSKIKLESCSKRCCAPCTVIGSWLTDFQFVHFPWQKQHNKKETLFIRRLKLYLSNKLLKCYIRSTVLTIGHFGK